MTVSLLELRRARSTLDEFCARRNAFAPRSVARLLWRQEGNVLLIGEAVQSQQADEAEGFRALVRLSYQNDRWYLFCRLKAGHWQPYPHLPQVETIGAVVEELEQAPLYVPWE